jgi:uracil-DNA glycosylase
MSIQFENSWQEILQEELDKNYMINLQSFLHIREKEGHTIFPPNNLIFKAFKHTPFDQVKVVIIGQDPYHGENQAHGLAFSVQKGEKLPPSLKNIYKELQSEYNDFQIPKHGDLGSWADQGVLLLNATLTVEASKAGSHQNQGWEIFTDKVIQIISEQRNKIVFLLWGKYAQAKAGLIDHNKHLILKAAHPSPFSAYHGFFGCNHFILTNEYLEKNGEKGIDWMIKEE